MKQFLHCAIIMLLLSACSSSNKLISEDELKRKNYQEVIGIIGDDIPRPEKFALYPGGINGIYKHLKEEVTYPSDAKENNIQGTVVTTFSVNKSGKVENVRVVQSVSEDLDKEAIRLIESMETWYPGMDKGKPVRTKYRQPIVFEIKSAKKK